MRKFDGVFRCTRVADTSASAISVAKNRKRHRSKSTRQRKAGQVLKNEPSRKSRARCEGVPPGTPSEHITSATRDSTPPANRCDGWQGYPETTFYFWKRLYSDDYEQSLWRTTLKRTFPNKRLGRAQIAQNLEYIYQARNRLAHHEPILHKRFRETISAIEFLSANMGIASPSEDTPLAKLIGDDLDQVKIKAQRLHDRLASFRTP